MWPNKKLAGPWLASFIELNQDSLKDASLAAEDLIHSFEVKAPLLKPDTLLCSTVIAEHKFAFSFGQPYVGNYSVNPACGSSWSKVIVNFEASVSGKQFDRYGALWFGGAELIRLTTQEPSGTPLTKWTFEKDVTTYANLFTKDQSVVLAIDNLVDNVYTGIFDVKVTVDFYALDKKSKASPNAADIIIPLSKSSQAHAWFSLPNGGSPIYSELPKLPGNIVRAELEVFYSPHQKDEFYYGNVPTGLANSDLGLYGGGTFKELQIYIDSTLVGLDWPFPTIYTGGMNPLAWRPIVAIGAFDLPTTKIDMTPFLSLLCDNNTHQIGINVTTAANDFWLVDSNLLLWVDHEKPSNEPFKGQLNYIHVNGSVPKESYTGDLNSTLKVSTSSSNSISASGVVYHSKGWTKTSVSTSVGFYNSLRIFDQTNGQIFDQNTEITYTSLVSNGVDSKLIDSEVNLETKRYPLKGHLLYTTDGPKYQFNTTLSQGLEISTSSSHGLHAEQSLKDMKLKSKLSNYQSTDGFFGTIRPGFATTQQDYSLKSDKQCYNRKVTASGGKVIEDVYPKC
ncbi:peptide N-acetyl-beta-D-glucosaminyl asparaginase amidase A-domain-containing protein [Globomyces pollinis-pini]|nr:peptide N-acetyl-beta-D-glucosaminyl asparaginase amidase A-domain-containing protein [Globomyces pollinis-pini]